MPRSARTLFFDVGNVLAYFDHERVVKNLQRLLGVDANRLREVVFGAGLPSQYESGRLDSPGFCGLLREHLGLPDAKPSDRELLDACSDIFWLNHEIVPVVAQLAAAGHHLGILSNTCDGHWRWLTRGQYRILPDLFPRQVLSYQVGCLKPDAGIYEETIRRSQIPPGEIFFVDDRPENIEGALRVGLDACLFQNVSTLIRDLQARNIIANY
ncbi:MAG: HAD family phosphatase [Planctomycetota bacterium]|nr:HAD family phosphatase [Planctomycetota bacterium]